MNQTALAVVAAIGGLAVIFLVVIGALATYDATAGNDMMDGMWDMMDDTAGMMDGMDGMHGMMGGGGPETAGFAKGQGEVIIEDFRFEPTLLTVTPGTVVKWTNEDSAPHTATAEDDSFDTGRLNKGESGQITFDEPGTHKYICDFHPSMEGKIVVSTADP